MNTGLYQLQVKLILTFSSSEAITVGTVPKYNRKIEETEKSRYPNTHIHDHLLSLLGIGTSIKINDGIKLVYFMTVI
jgi:hypothetical protein